MFGIGCVALAFYVTGLLISDTIRLLLGAAAIAMFMILKIKVGPDSTGLLGLAALLCGIIFVVSGALGRWVG